MATEQISNTTLNAHSYVNFHPQGVPCGRRSHILVVDDDCGVRDTLSLLLISAGYQLTMAPNAMQALQKLKNKTSGIAIVRLGSSENVWSRVSLDRSSPLP